MFRAFILGHHQVNLQNIKKNIRTETCREYRGYIIKYFVNYCETEGIIIYSFILRATGCKTLK
jgi:hypothetical protein